VGPRSALGVPYQPPFPLISKTPTRRHAANRIADRTGRGIITVVPVTSNVDRVFPFQVALSASDCGLKTDSKAQAEQVRSVALDRLQRRIGTVPGPTLRLLDNALRLHLSL
jgi:mRNA interferase MazF